MGEGKGVRSVIAARNGDGRVGLEPGLREEVKLDMETLERSEDAIMGI